MGSQVQDWHCALSRVCGNVTQKVAYKHKLETRASHEVTRKSTAQGPGGGRLEATLLGLCLPVQTEGKSNRK